MVGGNVFASSGGSASGKETPSLTGNTYFAQKYGPEEIAAYLYRLAFSKDPASDVWAATVALVKAANGEGSVQACVKTLSSVMGEQALKNFLTVLSQKVIAFDFSEDPEKDMQPVVQSMRNTLEKASDELSLGLSFTVYVRPPVISDMLRLMQSAPTKKVEEKDQYLSFMGEEGEEKMDELKLAKWKEISQVIESYSKAKEEFQFGRTWTEKDGLKVRGYRPDKEKAVIAERLIKLYDALEGNITGQEIVDEIAKYDAEHKAPKKKKTVKKPKVKPKPTQGLSTEEGRLGKENLAQLEALMKKIDEIANVRLYRQGDFEGQHPVKSMINYVNSILWYVVPEKNTNIGRVFSSGAIVRIVQPDRDAAQTTYKQLITALKNLYYFAVEHGVQESNSFVEDIIEQSVHLKGY